MSKRTCLDFMGLMKNSKKNKIQVQRKLQVEPKIAIEAQKKKTSQVHVLTTSLATAASATFLNPDGEICILTMYSVLLMYYLLTFTPEFLISPIKSAYPHPE